VPFYGAHFRISCFFEGKHIFTGTPDRCNTNLLTCNFIKIMSQISDVFIDVVCSTGCTRTGLYHVMFHWLQKDSVNTDCDCGISQADPSFMSVALGEFTAMKLTLRIPRSSEYSKNQGGSFGTPADFYAILYN
jgi:hypothetical protein